MDTGEKINKTVHPSSVGSSPINKFRESYLTENIKRVEKDRETWIEERLFLQSKIKYLSQVNEDLVKKLHDEKMKNCSMKSESGPVSENQRFSPHPPNLTEKLKNLKMTNQNLTTTHQATIESYQDKVLKLQSRLHYYKAENSFLKEHISRRNIGVNLMESARLARRKSMIMSALE